MFIQRKNYIKQLTNKDGDDDDEDKDEGKDEDECIQKIMPNKNKEKSAIVGEFLCLFGCSSDDPKREQTRRRSYISKTSTLR